MFALVSPDIRFHGSWLEAAAEFGHGPTDGSRIVDLGSVDLSGVSAFAAYVERLRADALPETPRKPGWVACTFLWMADGDEFVGSLAVRHQLNDFLLREGGHIGYSVRPGRRREGYASRALGLALPIAHELGIARALVTCDEANAASRATIEANGGVYEDSRAGKRRYWIDSAATRARAV